MPVYEVLHATGEWSVKLREETPIAVRDAITVPFGHLVVTSTHLPVDRFTGTQILNAALYSGVCLRPGPGLEISGKGLAWWLDQAVLETAVTNSAASLSTWLNDILQADSGTYPVSITSGGAATVAGTLSTSFQWVTRRQALDAVVRYYWGLEWKIRPSFDLVANSVTAIYGANPVAMIAARADGYEQASGMWGLSGQSRTAIDFESYATRVVAVGQDQIGGASITSIYRDPQGNVLSIGRMIDAPSTGQGLATSVATQVLATLDQPTYDFRLSAERYVISNRAPVGSTVNVYDPLNGFVDPANPVRFGGSTYFPRAVRLVGCRWPIEQGMGVYYRWYDPDDGSGPFFTDLTDYVEWETGAAELEVGTRMRGLDGSDATLASLAASPVNSGQWTEYAPTITNFTVGTGFATGWYRKDGSTLFLNLHVEFGSGPSESGLWQVNLPSGLIPPPPSGSRLQALHGHAYNIDGDYWRIIAEASNGASYLTFVGADGDNAAQFLGAGHPLTAVSGTGFYVSGVVEVDIGVEELAAPAITYPDRSWPIGVPIVPIVPTLTGVAGAITWTATGLPAGITLDSATGLLSGTPTVGGTGSATVTATNSAGAGNDTFAWAVLADATTHGDPVDSFDGSLVDTSLWDGTVSGTYTVSGGKLTATNPASSAVTLTRATLQNPRGKRFAWTMELSAAPTGSCNVYAQLRTPAAGPLVAVVAAGFINGSVPRCDVFSNSAWDVGNNVTYSTAIRNWAFEVSSDGLSVLFYYATDGSGWTLHETFTLGAAWPDTATATFTLFAFDTSANGFTVVFDDVNFG